MSHGPELRHQISGIANTFHNGLTMLSPEKAIPVLGHTIALIFVAAIAPLSSAFAETSVQDGTNQESPRADFTEPSKKLTEVEVEHDLSVDSNAKKPGVPWLPDDIREELRRKGRYAPHWTGSVKEVKFSFESPAGNTKLNWRAETYKVDPGQSLCKIEITITSQNGRPDPGIQLRDARPHSFAVNLTDQSSESFSVLIATKGTDRLFTERTWVRGRIEWSTVSSDIPEAVRVLSGCNASSRFRATKACSCYWRPKEGLEKYTDDSAHKCVAGALNGPSAGRICNAAVASALTPAIYCVAEQAPCPDKCISVEELHVGSHSVPCGAGKYPFWTQ